MGPRRTEFHRLVALASERLVGPPSGMLLTPEEVEQLKAMMEEMNATGNYVDLPPVADAHVPPDTVRRNKP